MTTRRDFLGRCAAALAVVAGLPRLVRAVEPQRWNEDMPTWALMGHWDGCYMTVNGERKRIRTLRATSPGTFSIEWEDE